MLSDYFRLHQSNELNIEVLNPTKKVRQFLSSHLYDSNMLLSYAPFSEYGSASKCKKFSGAYVCELDQGKLKLKNKINYRIIRVLHCAGLIVFRNDILPPHERVSIFGWNPAIEGKRREILRNKIFYNHSRVSYRAVSAIAGLYGLIVSKVDSTSYYEVLTLKNEPVSYDGAKHTYILSGSNGSFLKRISDLSLLEWEDLLFHISKKTEVYKSLSNSRLLADFFIQ